MIIKTPEQKDCDGIIEVLSKAFNKNTRKGSDEWEKQKNKVASQLSQWRIMLDDGSRVIAAVHIGTTRLQMGKAQIIKGDIGEVSVMPEMQGKGLGTILLKNTIQWMKEKKYDISRLGGLCKYYSRFGYIRFPRRYFEFKVGTKARAGASRVIEGEIPYPNGMEKCIRPFNTATDADVCKKIQETSKSRYRGFPLYENFEIKESHLNLVFEKNGTLLGYAEASEHETEISDFEARLRVNIHCYDENHPETVTAFMIFFHNYAFEKGIKRITARIPFDPKVIVSLASVPLRFSTIETFGGVSGNMLQIINFQSLMQRMIPEFENKTYGLLSEIKPLTISFEIEKDSVSLLFSENGIFLTDKSNPDITLTINEYDMLRMILGLTAFSEIYCKTGNKITGKYLLLLNSMFPTTLVSSLAWC